MDKTKHAKNGGDEPEYAPRSCSLEPPTVEQTINKIAEYTKWWGDKPQPYRGVALGQLNHTKRRLQSILRANTNITGA